VNLRISQGGTSGLLYFRSTRITGKYKEEHKSAKGVHVFSLDFFPKQNKSVLSVIGKYRKICSQKTEQKCSVFLGKDFFIFVEKSHEVQEIQRSTEVRLFPLGISVKKVYAPVRFLFTIVRTKHDVIWII
jgi:hypothetical protein